MAIQKQTVDWLADAFKEYFSTYEIEELWGDASLSVSYRGTDPDYQKIALSLSKKANQENIRTFLKQTCAELIDRIQAKIELAPAEDMIFHQQMKAQLEQLRTDLDKVPVVKKPAKPSGDLLFHNMLEIQSFFKKARGDVIVVDPTIDHRTLACFTGVKHRIRLMTRKDPDANLGLLEAALEKCRAKGINISIRRHATIHDHYIAFNDCCWLSNASPQNTNKTTLHLIEIKDTRKLILNDIARKWNEASPLS